MAHWIICAEKYGDIQIERPTECSWCDFSEYKAQRYKYCPMCGNRMDDKPETYIYNNDVQNDWGDK